MTTQKIVLAAPLAFELCPPRSKQRSFSFRFAPGNEREAKRRKAQPSIGRAAPASVAAHWCPGAAANPHHPPRACGGGKGGGRSPSGASPRRSRTRPNVSTQPRPRFTPASGCGRYPHHDWRLSEAPRAPILLPAGSMPGPPGSGAHILRPQEPHPLRLPKVPSRKASLDRAGCHRM
jgi:hypothetical protein